jgi:L-threonylcarbamoyladenylate synthase
MQTVRWVIERDQAAADHPAVLRAAQVIRLGGLVAFPTETVYGLGANALDARAVAGIYRAKQRPLNDPLIVHVASPADVEALADLSGLRERAQALIARFWPGPLTLVLPRRPALPALVSAGLDTVAVRMPNHPVALALIRASGVPLAAPSANRFGHVSPTTAQHVLDDLDGHIDAVLDGGPTTIGVESTVLDLTCDPPRILRPGGVTREQLRAILPSVLPTAPVVSAAGQAMPSPGTSPVHYAPRARLIICRDTGELLRRREACLAQGRSVGLLLRADQRAACQACHPYFVLGDGLDEVARNLYAGLRALDALGVDDILVTAIPREGLGEAIADRLARAAAKHTQADVDRSQ